eukprot:Gb_22387 [translate_table: standard]
MKSKKGGAIESGKNGKAAERKRVLKVKAKEKKKPKPKQRQSERQKQSQKEKEKEKKDPNQPKKPPTAFFFYMEDFRKIYKETNPKVTGMRAIGKACGVKWKEMTYEEKAPYFDIATQKRAEFEKALIAYKKKKEAGLPDEPDKSNSKLNDDDGEENDEE